MTDDHSPETTQEDEELIAKETGDAIRAVIRVLGEHKVRPDQLIEVAAHLNAVIMQLTEFTLGEIVDTSMVHACESKAIAATARLMLESGMPVQGIDMLELIEKTVLGQSPKPSGKPS
jgi:hypothetical protein